MEYQDNNQNGAQQGDAYQDSGRDWQQGSAYQDNRESWNNSQNWNDGRNWNNSQDWGNGNGSGRRLARSASNRMICGVCAGIAEYFNWDPTIVRLVWVGASILLGAGFMGLIAYFIAAVIMPER